MSASNHGSYKGDPPATTIAENMEHIRDGDNSSPSPRNSQGLNQNDSSMRSNLPPPKGAPYSNKSRRESIRSRRSGNGSVSKSMRTSNRNSAQGSDDGSDDEESQGLTASRADIEQVYDRLQTRDKIGNRARFSNPPPNVPRRTSHYMRSRRHTRMLDDEDTDRAMESEINDDDGHHDDEGMTLKDRQDFLNVTHPFGLPLWKPALYKKSRSVTRNARSALHSIPTAALTLSFGNILWFVMFGWWLSLVVAVASLPLTIVPYGGSKYAQLLRGLSWYIFWPFNKYVEKIHKEDTSLVAAVPDEEPLLGGAPRPVKPDDILLGTIAYYIVFYLMVAPVFLIASLINWLLVFSVPMAKLNYVMVKKLRRIPLQITFRKGSSMGADDPVPHPSLCTRYAFGLGYYKYTYDGINILFINLLSVVFFTLADYYILAPMLGDKSPLTSKSVIFGGCLVSTMPLAYFIGMAVSSISAQSSLGMGAVINATFGSIVEIILYCMALTEGKAALVEGSIIGSMLAGLLLMPGLSMIGGAVRKKQQRFNAKSAGVTSTMLIMSVIGVFITTLFYSTYATFELNCNDCPAPINEGDPWSCKDCTYYQPHPGDSQFYYDHARPLMYVCATLLPFAYIVCLFFTLRTHTNLIYAPQSNPSRAIQSLYRSLLPNYILQQLHLGTNNPPTDVEQQQEQQQVSQHAADSQEANLPGVEEEQPEASAFDNLDPIPLSVHHSLLDGAHLTEEQNQTIIRHAQKFLDEDDDDEDDDDAAGHDAPEWSKAKSAVILCTCTVLFSMIAELMVDSVDVVVEALHIREKILGLTLFALVPNVTEFVNAISFAIHGNISLSMEIGSAYTVQVALLQIPALVAFSAYYHWSLDTDPVNQSFTLVFPRLDMFSVLFSVFLITYIYIEGKSNYFKGTILVLVYVIWLTAFLMEPPLDHISGLLSTYSTSASSATGPHRVYV